MRDLGLVQMVDTTVEGEDNTIIPSPAGLTQMNVFIEYSLEETTDVYTIKAKNSAGDVKDVTTLP